VKANRQKGRALAEKLGYGPAKRLKVADDARPSFYRDPSLILLDQLKEVYIDGDWSRSRPPPTFPLRRKDYTVSLNSADQRPRSRSDSIFYGCGSSLNWDSYCNPEVDKMIELQSREADGQRDGNRSGHWNVSWRRTLIIFMPAPPLAAHCRSRDGQQRSTAIATRTSGWTGEARTAHVSAASS
jgi:hypothetical protein